MCIELTASSVLYKNKNNSYFHISKLSAFFDTTSLHAGTFHGYIELDLISILVRGNTSKWETEMDR